MAISAFHLKELAIAGGSIVLSQSKETNYSYHDLISIALCLKNNATLTIKQADNITDLQRKSIASAKPGQVIFDFS